MRELFLAFSVGWATGGFMLWGWFRSQRLIRTREEWYADPIIAAKYPEVDHD